jgi:hypothetical protein
VAFFGMPRKVSDFFFENFQPSAFFVSPSPHDIAFSAYFFLVNIVTINCEIPI